MGGKSSDAVKQLWPSQQPRPGKGECLLTPGLALLLVAARRSTFRMTRELEKYGAASSCIAGREHIAYVVEGTCLQTAEVTEILMDAALNQRWVRGWVES